MDDRPDSTQSLSDKAQPLTPREQVTDVTLRHLAHLGANYPNSVLTDVDLTFLMGILPDICGELLARRAVMLGEAA